MRTTDREPGKVSISVVHDVRRQSFERRIRARREGMIGLAILVGIPEMIELVVVCVQGALRGWRFVRVSVCCLPVASCCEQVHDCQ